MFHIPALTSFDRELGGVLLHDCAKACTQKRQQGHQAELPLVLVNCRVYDVEDGSYGSAKGVVIRCGKIVQLFEALREVGDADAAVMVDCDGLTLLPGLCDAHVHCTAVTANLAGLTSVPESYVASQAAAILNGMLARGFTTIRDAGGADWGLAQAVDEGLILGPRILFTGHALSQTGGHGDFRGKGEECLACGAALRGIGRVCDGDAEVRRAARDELRKGAHCIKVMASGGVASPTDWLQHPQFSEQELRAMVEEAEMRGTYVCAHAYAPTAIQRAVRCGVRSIEHGNYLSEETAGIMAASGTFLVPTLVTYQKIVEEGQAAGMDPALVAKVGDCLAQGLESLKMAEKAGVTMCYGSDLLGDMHRHQSAEFLLRRSAGLSPQELLQQATVNCAQLFGLSAAVGQVKPGLAADLLLVRGDPLQDIGVLTDACNIVLVIKAGLVAKAPGYQLQEVNYGLFKSS